MPELLLVFVLAYLIGSIPFGLILTQLFVQQDIREIGSGNIGATNVLRTGNKKLALITLIFDASKSLIATIFLPILLGLGGFAGGGSDCGGCCLCGLASLGVFV